MSTGDHNVFVNLRGIVCACNSSKLGGKSFCRRCYFKLPKDLRDALYQSVGYPETFRRALRFLKLPEPRVEPLLRDEPKSVERLRRNLRRALQ